MKLSLRTFTLGLPNNGGPAVEHLAVPHARVSCARAVEGWISNFGGCNVYLFEGELSLAQCQERVEGEQGSPFESLSQIDCLMILSGSGPVSTPMSTDTTKLTVFFEGKNESGQIQGVGLKLVEL